MLEVAPARHQSVNVYRFSCVAGSHLENEVPQPTQAKRVFGPLTWKWMIAAIKRVYMSGRICGQLVFRVRYICAHKYIIITASFSRGALKGELLQNYPTETKSCYGRRLHLGPRFWRVLWRHFWIYTLISFRNNDTLREFSLAWCQDFVNIRGHPVKTPVSRNHEAAVVVASMHLNVCPPS